MIAVDFHMHSKYSLDSYMQPAKIFKVAKQRGLSGVAITDHNNLPKFKQPKDFIAIKGEEIFTRSGEVIGLNLTEKIPALKGFYETLDAIRAQGGTILIPHPNLQVWSKRPWTWQFKGVHLEKVSLKKDVVIEVQNASLMYTKHVRAWAKNNGHPMAGNSDAHLYTFIGNTYTKLPYCSDADEVLKKLRQGYGIPTIAKRRYSKSNPLPLVSVDTLLGLGGATFYVMEKMWKYSPFGYVQRKVF